MEVHAQLSYSAAVTSKLLCGADSVGSMCRCADCVVACPDFWFIEGLVLLAASLLGPHGRGRLVVQVSERSQRLPAWNPGTPCPRPHLQASSVGCRATLKRSAFKEAVKHSPWEVMRRCSQAGHPS